MTVYIGTAGWSVPRQYAACVPADGSHLQRDAQVLNAAEINAHVGVYASLADLLGAT